MYNKRVFALFLLVSFLNCSSKLRSHLSSISSDANQIASSQNRTRYYSADPDDYVFAQGDSITLESCPKPNEIDMKNGICRCQKGMANFPFDGFKGVYCQYKQKSQLNSFLWELLTGIGIGHFIIHQHVKGSFKLVFFSFPFIVGLLTLFGVIKAKSDEGASGLIVSILLSLSVLAWLIWWLTDVIIFGLNKYRDSNAVPLSSWR